jgi:protein-L-isoaspartate O-methyltransferase
MPAAPLLALLAGLVLSGVAGVLNQVLWQRALRVFLGGSETLSAMVVVVVFLGGLGLGAAVAARRVGRVRSPLLALALVEGGLALTNLVVAFVLGLDLTHSIYGAWRIAAEAGIPLRLVYGLAATVLLLPPTVLMGATVPLAGAACQRQLGADSDALVPALFFVNTAGAALGAWSAHAALLPHLGQRHSLYVAVACNAVAGLGFAGLSVGRAATAAVAQAARARVAGLRTEELLGFLLGFLSLSFEMWLMRALTLAYEPAPETFAVALCAFLVMWSIGVALAGRWTVPVPGVGAVTGLLLAIMPVLHIVLRDTGELALLPAAALLSLPCIGFGLLYGGLVRSLTKDWGRDIGRYSAANTIGSCLGVLGFTLVGFESPLTWGALSLAVGVAAVAAGAARHRGVAVLLGVGALGTIGWGVSVPRSHEHWQETAWWGRDGVVEITGPGDVYIDGMWHSQLSDGRDHIGEQYAWLPAAAGVLGMKGRTFEDALVIGGGVGISATTIAKVEGVSVDTYEINTTLQRLLTERPAETLHSLENPRIHWMWRDARSGLALNDKKYDLIMSAPLLLRAAGSSTLLSLEYLDLVKSRLNPGGVVVVYANEGWYEQYLLIQRTLAERFRYRVTWKDGLVTVCSDEPIRMRRRWFERRMAADDAFAEELRIADAVAREDGWVDGFWGMYAGAEGVEWVADRPITDDDPLLEYPEIAEAEVVEVSTRNIGLFPQ